MMQILFCFLHRSLRRDVALLLNVIMAWQSAKMYFSALELDRVSQCILFILKIAMKLFSTLYLSPKMSVPDR